MTKYVAKPKRRLSKTALVVIFLTLLSTVAFFYESQDYKSTQSADFYGKQESDFLANEMFYYSEREIKFAASKWYEEEVFSSPAIDEVYENVTQVTQKKVKISTQSSLDEIYFPHLKSKVENGLLYYNEAVKYATSKVQFIGKIAESIRITCYLIKDGTYATDPALPYALYVADTGVKRTNAEQQLVTEILALSREHCGQEGYEFL